MQDNRSDRLPASLLAALALHAALLLIFAFVGGFAPSVPPVPVSVTLESPQLAVQQAQQQPEPAAAAHAAAPTERPAAAPAPQKAAADYRPPSAAELQKAMNALADNPPPASSRESGAAPAPLLRRATAPAPDNLPPAGYKREKDLLVPSPGATDAPLSKRELDLRELDRSLRSTPGAGTTAAAGSAPASAQGPAAGGAATGGITWETPGAARVMVTDVLPDIRRWRDLLPLRAEVVFRVDASGLVSSVRIEESTGFPAVDAAIMAAARHWVFKRSPGTPPVQGSRSIVFTSAEAR